jgi:DNA-binding transcriptional MocR family regulator
MSLDRRRALVDAAGGRGIPIIEDDPYLRLRYEGAALPTLLELDARSRSRAGSRSPANVIYLSTFSKILAPGLRLGWVIGPAALIAQLVKAKQGADLHTSSFTQRLVCEIARTGFLEKHIDRLRQAYATRRDAMLDAIADSFPSGVRYTRPSGGLFIWVTLPEAIEARDVLRDAIAHKVVFIPGESFHADGGGANTLRLNFTHSAPEQIREGIARLGCVLARCLDPTPALRESFA